MVIFSFFPANIFAQNVERILFKGSEFFILFQRGFVILPRKCGNYDERTD